MSITVISDSHGPFNWRPEFPDGFRGPLLPGGSPFHCSGDFGCIVVQEVVREQYSIRYYVMKFFRKMVLHWTEEEKLRVQFALSQKFSYQRQEQSIIVKPHHYNLVWAPEEQSFAHFSKGKEFRFLNVLYNEPFVRELCPEFPAACMPREKIIHPVGRSINDIIHKLLSNPHKDSRLFYYLESQVRDLLFSIMPTQWRKQLTGYSEEEERRVYIVDSLIMTDIKVHHTIPWLARTVKMRESVLKEAYKDIIGQTIYDRLKKARMQRASELLLTTDIQVQWLCEEVGYESLSGFREAFGEWFGISPYQYRKKQRPAK
jgi:AraC-like DNA-binding protein